MLLQAEDRETWPGGSSPYRRELRTRRPVVEGCVLGIQHSGTPTLLPTGAIEAQLSQQFGLQDHVRVSRTLILPWNRQRETSPNKLSSFMLHSHGNNLVDLFPKQSTDGSFGSFLSVKCTTETAFLQTGNFSTVHPAIYTAGDPQKMASARAVPT